MWWYLQVELLGDSEYRWVMRLGHPWWISVLRREARACSLALSLFSLSSLFLSTMWEQRKSPSTSQEESSPRIKVSSTLMLDFLPSRTMRNEVSCFIHLVYGVLLQQPKPLPEYSLQFGLCDCLTFPVPFINDCIECIYIFCVYILTVFSWSWLRLQWHFGHCGIHAQLVITLLRNYWVIEVYAF